MPQIVVDFGDLVQEGGSYLDLLALNVELHFFRWEDDGLLADDYSYNEVSKDVDRGLSIDL